MSLVKVCQGCLSADRTLTPVGKHAKLYQALLLRKSIMTGKKQWMLCWECHKILDNIDTFRMKITQAQKLLTDKSLAQYTSLSNLSPVTKLEDYKMIIYEDFKDSIPVEFEMDDVKNEKREDTEAQSRDGPRDVQKSDESEIKHFDALKIEIVKDEHDDAEDIFDSEIIVNIAKQMQDDSKIKKEFDEPLIDIDVLAKNEKETAVIVKKTRRKRAALKQKYRTIIMEDIPDKRKLYDKVKIDDKGLEEWLEKKRRSTNTKQFQCERCFCGFSQQRFYDRHLAVRHAKRLGSYECDICGFRFAEKRKLAYHINSHFVLFVCKLCGQECYTRSEMYVHFAHGPHGRQRECKKCGMRFDCRRRREFYDHYKYMHEMHVCDYCGRNFQKKTRLVSHIYKHHTVHRCKICNVTYTSLDSFSRHHKEKHVVDVTEQNYCVECNMQFINSARYNRHLKRSVRHRPTPAIPCPECGKVYTKNCSMQNHYNLVHLKKSNYHCAVCDTYYLTGHRLRYHQKYFHEKRPKPKNKLCKYCGKGFNNNRMLDNHVRTHTGERPFACTQCTAAFTQKQSLTAHERSAHK